ncbi:Rv3235 family protein [Pseudonocardia sp. GCM10023141]|uniref:Rv3235 family protein n=1 Tax=Pseudonocardia sp. GCM10023141 TaxID=3252653 RepID=UPI003614191C
MQYEPDAGAGGAPPPIRLLPPLVDDAVTATEQDVVQDQLTRVLRLAMEVLDRRRPDTQLAPHFTARTLRYWRIATEQRRARAPARVDRVVTSFPHPDAVELAAVCAIDGRIRALAARFERRSAAAPWRCTALRLG